MAASLARYAAVRNDNTAANFRPCGQPWQVLGLVFGPPKTFFPQTAVETLNKSLLVLLVQPGNGVAPTILVRRLSKLAFEL